MNCELECKIVRWQPLQKKKKNINTLFAKHVVVELSFLNYLKLINKTLFYYHICFNFFLVLKDDIR